MHDFYQALQTEYPRAAIPVNCLWIHQCSEELRICRPDSWFNSFIYTLARDSSEHIYGGKNWTPCPESVSELYWPSDCRLSAKLVPNLADWLCHVVSVTDPYVRLKLEYIFKASTPVVHMYVFLFDFNTYLNLPIVFGMPSKYSIHAISAVQLCFCSSE
jgi:hypothetical protein